MFEIKANPLRISTVIFTGVIVIMMLIYKFIPGNYTVQINDSLKEEISSDAVSLKELRTMLQQQDRDFLLIDIRSPEDFKAGHLKEAVNIPKETLLDKKNRKVLRKNKCIIYCSTESMSHSVSFLLRQCGYNCRPVNSHYEVIKEKVIDKYDPSFMFFSEEKQQYNYPAFIKQHDAPTEFQVDKKTEIKIQSGC